MYIQYMNSEIINKKYNKLKIIKLIDSKTVECLCDCGNIKKCNLYDIKRNRIKACGCAKNTLELRKAAKERACLMIDSGILNRGGDFHSKEYREFKYILKCLKNSGRKKCEVSLEDLKSVWDRQGGMCVYSKIKLKLPSHSNNNPGLPYEIASVDRIDSSKPYSVDNIQYVSRNINYAKHKMSHEQMMEFMKEITKNYYEQFEKMEARGHVASSFH